MFPGRQYYEYRYFSMPRVGDTLDIYKSREYDQMLSRLNRENEELNKNVIDLIRENTRLKTVYYSQFRSDISPRNRSYQRTRERQRQQRYVTPSPKRQEKISVPYSAQMTTNSSKTPQIITQPRSFKTFVTQKQAEQKQIEATWNATPSITFIEQLSQKNFQTTGRNASNSLSKSRKGLQLSKEIGDKFPPNEESVKLSQIQVEQTAEVSRHHQMPIKNRNFSSQSPVDPKTIIEDIKKGIHEVRSRLELHPSEQKAQYSPNRKLQFSPERRVQHSPPKINITYSNRQDLQQVLDDVKPNFQQIHEVRKEPPKLPHHAMKKDNRPYVLDSLETDQHHTLGHRSNGIYLPGTPKFKYSPTSAQPHLFRQYY